MKVSHRVVHGCHVFHGVRASISMEALAKLAGEWMHGEADVILWQMHRITWGTWDGKAFRFLADDVRAEEILEVRIFNREEELRLHPNEDEFLGRYLRDVAEDAAGDKGDYIDSFSRLWGCKASVSPEGFVELRDENRKLSMTVPYHGDAEKADWYGLTTRNYIASDEKTGLSGYSDSRFVAIEPAQEAK